MRLIEKTHENESKYKSSQCNRPYPVCNRGVFPRSIDDERQLRQLVLNSSTIGCSNRQFPCNSHQSKERKIAGGDKVAYVLERFHPNIAYVLERFYPKVAYVLENICTFATDLQIVAYVHKRIDKSAARMANKRQPKTACPTRGSASGQNHSC